METRTKLWKKYREEINNNIKLQEAVTTSHQELLILNKRLLDVFPTYHEQYKVNFPVENQNFFQEINQSPHFSTSEIDKLQDEIKQVQVSPNTFKAITNMDFSSHELDDMIKAIRHRNDVVVDNNFKNFKKELKMEPLVVKDHKRDHQVPIQVAIDGPSGSGKSTVAKHIAQKYHLKYINTGLVYRAIAYHAIVNNIDLNNETAVLATLEDGMIKLLAYEKVILKDVDVSLQLRTNEISQAASRVSIHKKVRAWATTLQKKYGLNKKIIMDGRDTTFNIMPHANIKIFLDSSIKERVKRRSRENAAQGLEADVKKIFREIKERDHRDRNRKTDPLHQTKDAHLIIATKLSIKQVVAKISEIIERQLHHE